MGKNWRTSLAGLLGFLGVLCTQLVYAYDGVTTTNPDWSVVVASFSGLVMGLLAKDYNVTGRAKE